MGNETTKCCAQTLTLDDIESTSGQYPLNADAKRMSLDSIETRPNLKPITSKKANKSIYSKSCVNLKSTNNNPPIHKKQTTHNRSQSNSSDTSTKNKSTKHNKHKKRRSKSHKKKSKQKHDKSKYTMDSNINSNTKMDAKYTAQEIEKKHLRKENEELMRQNELLRSKLKYNLSTMSHIDQAPQIDTKQKSAAIDIPSYQQSNSSSIKKSATPYRAKRPQLKLSIAPTSPQRPILHPQCNDKKRVYDAMKTQKQTQRPLSPLVAPLPALEPIYSKDDGDQFEEHTKLKEKGSGRARYFSDGNIIITDPKQIKKDKIEQEYHNNTNEENIWNMYFDGECENVKECIAVQRMIRALKWFSKLNGNADDIWKKIKDKQYGNNLINDYHHIMHYHLNKMDTMDMKREKMMICAEINKIVNKCDIKSCKGYKRNQFESNNEQSEHIPFYVRCIDTIHCYFMHFDALQL